MKVTGSVKKTTQKFSNTVKENKETNSVMMNSILKWIVRCYSRQ